MPKNRQSLTYYPLLAFVPAAAVLGFAASALSVLFINDFNTGVFTYPLLLVPAIIEIIFYNALTQRREISYRLGELIIIPPALYAVYALFTEGPIKYRFALKPENFFFSLGGLAAWVLTFLLHRRFYHCEEYAALEDEKRKDLLSLINDDLKLYSKIVRIFFWICLMIVIPVWLLGRRFSPGLPVLAALVAVALLACLQRVGALNKFYWFKGQSVSFSKKADRSQGISALSVLLISAITALLITGKKPLVPLLEIIKWFLSLFESSYDGELQMIPERQAGPIVPQEVIQNADVEMPFFEFFRVLMKIVCYTAAVLIIISLIISIINYFRYRRGQIKRMRLLDALKAFLKGLPLRIARLIKDIFLFLFSLGKRKIPPLYDDMDQVPLKLADIRTDRTPEKKREVNKIIKFYCKLIRWGAKRGTPWKGQMPVEYNEELAGKYEEWRDSLEEIVRIYEESLFSDHLIPKSDIIKYCSGIKEILSS